MTGDDVHRIRTGLLGATAKDLSQILGVDQVTIYRWERQAQKEIAFEGLSSLILGHVDRVFSTLPKPLAAAKAKRIIERVRVCGTLAGLALLLIDLTEEGA